MDPIFENLDSIIVNPYYESPIQIIFKEPEIDLVALKLEFYKVYVDTEIFYQNKIAELNKTITMFTEMTRKSVILINNLKDENDKLKRK